MRLLTLIVIFHTLGCGAYASFWSHEEERKPFLDRVWEAGLPDFSPGTYREAVPALLAAFESATGKSLRPGPTGRAGIKVYTQSGPGLATPHALTAAVIESLVERGFARSDLILVDANPSSMRESGYLPPLGALDRRPLYLGVPVLALDTDAYWDLNWYYDNPLPAYTLRGFAREVLGEIHREPDPNDRKSYLPRTLLLEVDFWINLPVGLDHPATGVMGALGNATLWNVSNRERFFASPSNAPIAVAEIAAIPELVRSWAFTLFSLERFQIIGGPQFNSLYTRSHPSLLLAVNPVILDVLLLHQINLQRRDTTFRPLDPNLLLFEYAHSLGLGTPSRQRVQRIPVLPPAH